MFSKPIDIQTRFSGRASVIKAVSFLVVLVVTLLTAPAALGENETTEEPAEQPAASAPAPTVAPALAVQYVITYTEKACKVGRQDCEAGMGDRISVGVKGLSDAIKAGQVKPEQIVLYLQGRALKNVHPESIAGDELVFKLERTTESRDAWNALLGRPRLDYMRPTLVSVGLPNDQPIKPVNQADPPRFNLIVYRPWWAVGCLVGLIVITILILKYGKRDLFRDSSPPNPGDGQTRPYSLAKAQAAWWFILVVGSFLLIYLVTGEFTMSEQALILMGIGTGTALGAAMIDANKTSTANTDLYTLQPEKSKLTAEIAALEETVDTLGKRADPTAEEAETRKAAKIELAEKQATLAATQQKIDEAEASQSKPVSEGLLKDLLTDANGVSFHRFQMIVWTLVLGGLFLIGVYKDLAMPEFSVTMLALMGISAGTYLGFKIPEKQSE